MIQVLETNAQFDSSGRHRLWLRRVWDETGKVVVYVMLNPSVGNATANDMTIKRCINKAIHNNFGAMEIVNLYSYVTPYPEALWQAQRAGTTINHPDNDRWIEKTCRGRAVVLACGGKAEVSRLNEVVTLLKKVETVPMCAAKTGGKIPMPKHPLAVCDNVFFQKF